MPRAAALSSPRRRTAWLLVIAFPSFLDGHAAAQLPPGPSVQRARVRNSYDALGAAEPLADKLQGFISDATPAIAKLLAERGYRHTLLVTSQGLSCGNFRATLDGILVGFIGPPK
jgi:hypothetical protein